MFSVWIPLTQNKMVIVDSDDAESVKAFDWYAQNSRGRFYAARQMRLDNGKQKLIFLHNWLVNPPDDMLVDHINGDSLDCRRSNLRLCTQAQNMRNVPLYRNSTSGYKGVSLQPTTGRWKAYISMDGDRHNLGDYGTAAEAARAYDARSRELHGEFGRLNFPNEVPPPFIKPRLRSNNTSGYRGVAWNKSGGKHRKYVAYMRVNGERIHLGSFPTAEAASEAYEEAVRIRDERAP